jgi:hypothetical protein
MPTTPILLLKICVLIFCSSITFVFVVPPEPEEPELEEPEATVPPPEDGGGVEGGDHLRCRSEILLWRGFYGSHG